MLLKRDWKGEKERFHGLGTEGEVGSTLKLCWARRWPFLNLHLSPLLADRGRTEALAEKKKLEEIGRTCCFSHYWY